MVAPDDKMKVPIGQLLFWAAQCMRRVTAITELPPDVLERPDVRAVVQRENEFVHAYRTVLRLRAKEVAAFCDGIGLYGYTAEMVRSTPFLIAMAIDEHMQGGT